MQKIDIRIEQATDFLRRACGRLPKSATKAMWRKITVPLICKRIGWKGRHDSFLRQFEKLHGCTLKQHMDALWREHRQRTRPKRTTFPVTFQVGEGWAYYPSWLPEGTQVGDWIEIAEGGSVRRVDGPERKMASG